MNRVSKYIANTMDKLTHYPTLGGENTNIVDIIVSFLLAISPLLQHYKGFMVNAGFIVLIVCLPYVCLKLLLRYRSLKLKNALFTLPLVLFQIYRVFAHGATFTEMAHGAVLCGYFVAIALGGINLKYVARWTYIVSMAASITIIIQTLFYYIFGSHLQVVITDLLLEESNKWVRLAETGIIGINGRPSSFYRPSAFFLEPSHMFLYFIPNLALLLLTPDSNWMKRISGVILSFGLILSTSGMGIALVVGVWLLHLGFGNGKENLFRIKHLFTKQNILRCVSFVLIFVMLSLTLPFLRYSVLRIFLGSGTVSSIIIAEQTPSSSSKPTSSTATSEITTSTTTSDTTTSTTTSETISSDTTSETTTSDTTSETVTSEPTTSTTTSDTTASTTTSEPTSSTTTSEPTSSTTTSESTTSETTTSETTTSEPTTSEPTTSPDNKEPGKGGSTAISGRIERAFSLVTYRMKGAQYIFGVSDKTSNGGFNLPGFFSSLYKYGIIGVLLSYMFYVACALFGKQSYRWMAIIVLVTSIFSAHTHGTFYMLLYILLMADGLISKYPEGKGLFPRKKKPVELEGE